MREIKFRAWDKKNKKMYEVYELYFRYDMETKKEIMKIIVETPEINLIEFSEDEVELMQFTGLKDKNGKEICEGDVVKNIYGVISMVESLFWFGRRCGLNKEIIPILEEHFEVIGNIYENLKHLEETKK